MKTIVTLACLILSFGYGGLAISQDSPNDVSVDQYLLEATKAIENGDTQRALKLLSTARSKLKESDRRQAAAQPRPAKDKAFLQKVLQNLKKQMVHARGGTFRMGCTGEQRHCFTDEKPVHQVQVSDFEIGKYEVTQSCGKPSWERIRVASRTARSVPSRESVGMTSKRSSRN